MSDVNEAQKAVDPTSVKELRFSKASFPNQDDVRVWCRKNHYSSSDVVDHDDEWHVHQKRRGDFINDDFQVAKVEDGVSAEVGNAREGATAPDARLGATLREGAGLVKDEASNAIVVAEGGRYVLNEDDGDMARLSDGALKKLRGQMVEKRTAIRTAHGEMADEDKYGSPEGSAVLDDMYYYNQLISRLENEMACRTLTLD